MENNETIIEVKGISIMQGKSGQQYFSIETDQGKLTCFEKKITDELQKNVGNKVKVEIVTNDRGFRNIRKFLGAPTKSEIMTTPAVQAKQGVFAEARQEKNKSMYVSYTKDIFLEIYKTQAGKDIVMESVEELMTKSIKLIKMASQAFDSPDEVITDE
jgi:hypothetical protein